MFVVGRKKFYFIGVLRIDLWQTRIYIGHETSLSGRGQEEKT
jgi:hypothetical protein